MARRKRKLATLALCGYAVHVWVVPGLAERAHAKGLWHPDDRRIEIDADLSQSEALEVLIHECVHAVADSNAIRLSEQSVTSLALGLHQLLSPVVVTRWPRRHKAIA